MRVRGGKLEIRKKLRRRSAKKRITHSNGTADGEVRLTPGRGGKERINEEVGLVRKGADRSNEPARPGKITGRPRPKTSG
jgi:hypothetical protein